jgi:Flp pilus assembly protein TadD
VARAIAVRPNAAVPVRFRRGLEEREVVVQLAHRTNTVPGRVFTQSELDGLSRMSADWLSNTQGTERQRLEQARRRFASNKTRAAACNNLGVLYQLEEAHGPAIRAYREAVYLDSAVPLYRFNLAMALRDIGSVERAYEELEEVLRLAPEAVDARLGLVELQSLLGNLEEALALTDAALEKDPQHHGLWEIKSEILWKQQRFAEASAAARTAVATEPGCAVARHFLAVALNREGRSAEAEAAARTALQLAPLNPLFHLTLGSIQTGAGQLVAAEQSLRQAVALKADFQLAWRDLGRVLASRGQSSEAKSAFDKAGELDPDDLLVIRELGRLALREGRLDEAEQQFRKAMAAAPQDWECYFDLGQVLQRRGQMGDAERMYLRALEVAPSDSASFEKIGAMYRDQLGRLDKAEELHRKAVALSPRTGRAYSGLGQTLAMAGKMEEAERVVRQAAELEPGSSHVHTTLGEVLRLSGKIDEALLCNRKALELNPNNAAAYNNLGIIYAVRKEYREAERMFRELVDRSKANFGSVPFNFLFNLGSVLLDQQQWAEAEKIIRQAKALAPDNPDACSALAKALANQQRNLDEALILSRRAVQIAPNEPNHLNSLGWVLFHLGELDEAEATLKKALEIAREEPPAPEIREHLKKVLEKRANLSK